ncbi:KUP/HAK/KT family potassium transporter [Deminuibacter soli]|uniref:Probable potassium transport system protein Kup n=1 Tax=Deminuibacter soli TaxID=2291815 RepID=A0A3E1NNI3_9BACT|nr:KUP/HAK/KT family potassium transporter [Deminuibacter soli]RFM29491.1 potassium transporter Kup [Deminuibacter soli]
MSTKSGSHAHPDLSKLSIAGLLITLGIIYGDIGTSPLYVFKSILGKRDISDILVYGGISCVFWTLTLQTTFKYVILTLRADNKGEGGVFSLYALIRRYAKWVYIPAILGAATLLADGIITPPISVASAIEGLNGVKGLEKIIVPGNNLTVGIVIAIISLLFFFQRFGTKVVGAAFGPIMFVWFSMILVLGVVPVLHNPAIIRALNPWYAYNLLVNYPKGFWLLGAVFLCSTGAEALYSDLGHCGRKNIQGSWIFVKLALVVNYLGQGAWILSHNQSKLNGLNPFYELMPEWFLVPGIVIATLATIIASQALISGSFTLISEAISMNFWPRVRIKFPTTVKGQSYIPSINWILCLGCVGMMLYFRESGHMEAAYGFSIVVAMLMTTCLMYMYMRYVRKWPLLLIAATMLIFITVESAFFIANVAKIKQRWMFLFFELGLTFIMFIWYRARKITNRYLQFTNIKPFIPLMEHLGTDMSISKYGTHLVYLTKANSKSQIEKRIVESILYKKPKRADVYWFVHIDRTDAPYTMEYDVHELVEDKIIRVDFRIGFRIQPRVHSLLKRVMQEMSEAKQLATHDCYECLDRKDFHTDITYVIIERFLSIENELTVKEDFILDAYFFLKRISQTDQKAFGLDASDTVLEYVPLIIAQKEHLPLKRIGS